MKKQLLPGVALGCSLLLSSLVCADPIWDTTDPASLQKTEVSPSPANPEKSDPAHPNGPYQDRATNTNTNDLGARWTDRNQQTTLMAFTSTFAADQAARQMGGSSGSLSFASFGRVPFYQTLSLTDQINTTSSVQTNRPVASLPEPATLTLLGAGLAALAAGLRKRNKKSSR